MSCYYCKGSLEKATTEYVEKQGSVIVIIENVPCDKCTQCGEPYFSTEVAQRLNEILDSVKSISTRLTVAVVDYLEKAA